MASWSSASIGYNLGDVVYYSATSQWYRCIKAHASSSSITPSSTAYWTNAPSNSITWNIGKSYSAYDPVSYKGINYLSLTGTSNYGQNPVSTSGYWQSAATTSTQWDSTTSFSSGTYRSYDGVWYICVTGGVNKTPNNTANWTALGATVIYAEGTVTLPDGSAPIKTQVRANIAPAPLFPNAVAASTTVTANSGGLVDSYDSTASTPSSTQYSGQVNSGTNFSAVIAAGNTSSTAVTLTSTTVKGYLAVPSSSASVPLYSTGGTVKGISTPALTAIDLTHISRSPYIPQFDTLPGGKDGLSTNWSNTHKGLALQLASTVNIGTPGATTPSRYYYNGSLTIGSASIQFLNINGPVILFVNGDLSISNPSATGRITVNTAGSAEIHVSGAFKADIGGDGILSYTYDPKTVTIICDTSSSADHFYSEGVYPLYGVLYAPYTTSINGYYNTNNATNVYGAISAKKVTYSGANMNIHYDTSLRYALTPGVNQPYAITEWRELTDSSELANMP
jgi:hypothetical protein